MAVEKPNKEKFTFWANMRETIEQNEDVELKYKLYSALTNYGLYRIEPDENDKDYIGLGLSDSSFFKQFIPILKNIPLRAKSPTKFSMAHASTQSFASISVASSIKESSCPISKRSSTKH